MIIDNPSEAIQDMTEQLAAMCLKQVPTVEVWRKTKMSKHVAKYVNDRGLPPMLCNIIKEEYPEWFI